MTIGDWAQVLVSAAALVVSAAVAIAIYVRERRERRERRQVEEAATASAVIRAEAERQAADERESRAVRRQQHAGDYEATKEALTQAERIFELVHDEPRTALELDGFGIDDPRRTLDAIARRVPDLHDALRRVVNDLLDLGRPHFPAIPPRELDPAALHTFVRQCVAAGLRQTRAADLGLSDVARARDALRGEWGS